MKTAALALASLALAGLLTGCGDPTPASNAAKPTHSPTKDSKSNSTEPTAPALKGSVTPEGTVVDFYSALKVSDTRACDLTTPEAASTLCAPALKTLTDSLSKAASTVDVTLLSMSGASAIVKAAIKDDHSVTYDLKLVDKAWLISGVRDATVQATVS